MFTCNGMFNFHKCWTLAQVFIGNFLVVLIRMNNMEGNGKLFVGGAELENVYYKM